MHNAQSLAAAASDAAGLPPAPERVAAADPLESTDPGLHQAVRDTYRDAILGGATQRQAFDGATDLLAARQPRAQPDDVRRLVARMLACEPIPPAPPGDR